MVNKRILEYFRMYKGHYKLSELKKKVMQEGYTKKEIDIALNQLTKETSGDNPPTVGATVNKINNMNFSEENSNKEAEKENSKSKKDQEKMKKKEEKKRAKEEKKSEIVKKPKSWVGALVLSILFGSLGIDRFYMGYIWTGLLKLITLGGFGVWYIIDIILIATKYEYAKVIWN